MIKTAKMQGNVMVRARGQGAGSGPPRGATRGGAGRAVLPSPEPPRVPATRCRGASRGSHPDLPGGRWARGPGAFSRKLQLCGVVVPGLWACGG